MKRFYINSDDIQTLGLTGSVLLCYTALRALCANPSNHWTGSYQRLSDESGCGSHDTAKRSVSELIRRGLVNKQDGTYYITQNASSITQNALPITQIASNPKEKRTKKENIIKENNKSETNSTLALYKTILENGYLHPQMHLKNMNSYYNANGWKSDDMVAVLANWMRREQQFGHEPQMDEQAAEFICDLVDCLPAYQETFCDALQAVKIEGNKALLYVPEARRDNLLNWMSTLDLDPLLRRYQMSIKIYAAA